MSAVNDDEMHGLRHLHALRNFIGNLVDQADKSGGCECHKPPSLLLVGPPGAGKTYLVKQMSKVCEMPLFGVHTHQVSCPSNIEKLFRQARESFPSLVFLDDIDCIFADHEQEEPCSPSVKLIREAIFAEMGPRKLKIHDSKSTVNPIKHDVTNAASTSSRDSSRSSTPSGRPQKPSAPSASQLNDSYDESLYPDNNGIIVVAATSAPWKLRKDHELLSRFRGIYLVGLPDIEARYTLLQQLLGELHHTLSDEEVMEVAERTNGFTPADLMVLVKTLGYGQFSFLFKDGAEDSDGSITHDESDTDSDGLNQPKGYKSNGIGDKPVSNGGEISTAKAAAAVTALAAVAAGAIKSHKNGPKKQQTAPPPPPAPQPVPEEGLASRINPAAVIGAVGAAATVAAIASEWPSDSEEENEIQTARENAYPSLDMPDSSAQLNGTYKVTDTTKQNDENVNASKQEESKENNGDCSSTDSDTSNSTDDSNVSNVFYPNDEESTYDLMVSAEKNSSLTNEQAEGVSRYVNAHPSTIHEQPLSLENNQQSDSVNSIVDKQPHSSLYNEQPHSADSLNEHTHSNEQAGSISSLINEQPHSVGSLSNGNAESISSLANDCASNNGSVGSEDSGTETTATAGIEVVFSGSDNGVEEPTEREEMVVTPDCVVVSHELHYSEGPDAENMAVDSDSDNEGSAVTRRQRRVNFNSERSDKGAGLNNLLGGDGDNGPHYEAGGNASSSGDHILRQLLSRPVNGAAANGVHTSSPTSASPTPPSSPSPSTSSSPSSSGRATFASSGSGRGSPNVMPVEYHNSTRTPIPKPGHGPKRLEQGTNSHNGGDSSGSDALKAASGMGVAAAVASLAKRQGGSDSSTGGTPKINNDDIAKLMDALEAHMGGDDDDDSSEGDSEDDLDGDEMEIMGPDGKVSIQPITFPDVVKVLEKGYRSVSKEEIFKYSQFMSWFASVAKSACPHNNGNQSGSTTMEDEEFGVESTVCATPSLMKRNQRRKPLKKLGRFLLKALVFILD